MNNSSLVVAMIHLATESGYQQFVKSVYTKFLRKWAVHASSSELRTEYPSDLLRETVELAAQVR